MIFGSICSGIEAASAAWVPVGWQCSFMSEIDAFPRAVLTHHYPETKLHGDFTTIQHATATAAARRLTPTECEKLQGFAPGYTAIPYRGKPAADGPRYRALGNSMAVPVMRWIGRRIEMQSGVGLYD